MYTCIHAFYCRIHPSPVTSGDFREGINGGKFIVLLVCSDLLLFDLLKVSSTSATERQHMLAWILAIFGMMSFIRPTSAFRNRIVAGSVLRQSVTAMNSRQQVQRHFRLKTLSNTPAGLDTIFALSSGPIVKSGVAVVRISGPSSLYCLEQLTIMPSERMTFPEQPKPRLAKLKYLYSPVTKDVLDQSLILWFPGPRSFTGEDVVELHVHGSRAVIKGVFEALEHLDDPSQGRAIRPAAPGEFTRRAFENGKMDLTEVEGLSDLLEAETSEQRKQALKQMDGHLRKQYEAWRYIYLSLFAILFVPHRRLTPT